MVGGLLTVLGSIARAKFLWVVDELMSQRNFLKALGLRFIDDPELFPPFSASLSPNSVFFVRLSTERSEE